MPSKKPMFTLRTDNTILEKLQIIADKEHRSANLELEYILLKYIEEYEKEHGEIAIKKD